jgi:hypothetical protein
MKTLPETILLHAQALPEGGVLSPKEFLHLGSRAAVDQAMSRLSKEGKLLRVARGTYAAPVSSRFGKRAPAAEKLVEELAEQRGEIIAPHGAAAANALGLTTQVPMRTVYLTSGRSRQLKLGAQKVELRHAPGWQLTYPKRRAGQVVRALAWLGPEKAAHALEQVRSAVGPEELLDLKRAQTRVPSWMARQLSELVANA